MILGSINLVANNRRTEKPAKKSKNDLIDHASAHPTKPVFVFDIPSAKTSTYDEVLVKTLTDNVDRNTQSQCSISKGKEHIHSHATDVNNPQEPGHTSCQSSCGRVRGCSSARSSGYASCSSVTSSPLRVQGDTTSVTIATTDGYNVYVDPSFFHITLKSQKQPTCCSLFSQTVLKTVDKPSGRIHAVVFALKSDPDYFLSTSKSRELELQMFGAQDAVTKETKDSRVFFVHESHSGVSFIQPIHHKGVYLHHIDASLSLRKLDLNLRPPEEFFFQVIKVNDSGSNPDHLSGYVCGLLGTESSTTLTCLDLQRSEVIPEMEIPIQNFAQSGSYSVNVTSRNYRGEIKDKHEQNMDCIVTATAEVKLRRSGSKRDKTTYSNKRNSLYNVVAMTGNCFGLGKKEVFSSKPAK